MSGFYLEEKTETPLEAKRHAEYELERQRKLRKLAEVNEEESDRLREIEAFLRCVAYGEQDQAEEMLRKNRNLALKRGRLIDLSAREFQSITGFQYALWALDWHMWKMLLEYLDKEAAAIQFAEWEAKGTAQGKHVSLAPLIEALNAYAQNSHPSWDRETNGMGLQVERISQYQLLLPVHVVNEYCRPGLEYSFYTISPRFAEETLPRSLKVGKAEWFAGSWRHMPWSEERAPRNCFIVRYNQKLAEAVPEGLGRTGAGIDAKALQNLLEMRQQQLECLRVQLQYLLSVKGWLGDYFPSVVSSAVLGYI